MKVGMFLQDIENSNWEQRFGEVLSLANLANLDLLVFPEKSMCPDVEKLRHREFFTVDGYETIKDYVCELSRKAGCAVIFCQGTIDGCIYSFYANENREANETHTKEYLKHIATDWSPLNKISIAQEDFDYDFRPIIFKGLKIGQTVCYDSTLPLLSRLYGMKNIDLLINSTGGHVDYKKWSYFQKVRAIENKCNNLCVMAHSDSAGKNKSYVFAYDKYGCNLPLAIINKDGSIHEASDNAIKDALYFFNISPKDIVEFDADEYLEQKETQNKNVDFNFATCEIKDLLNKAEKITEDVYCLPVHENNLIMCVVNGEDILFPESVPMLEYNNALKGIKNKRYLIINKWDDVVDSKFYDGVLSNVLKVRAVENYSALVFADNKREVCFQTGRNKNVQVVGRNSKGQYGLDFSRMTGPESLWKNNDVIGVRASWRKGYEEILRYILENRI